MTNPFLDVSKLLSTVFEVSAQLFAPMVRCMLTPVTTTGQAVSLYPVTEGKDGTRGRQQAPFLYGRIRWAAPRIIIEWQTKQQANKDNFAVYRGHSSAWSEARLLDLSIFTTANSQTHMATYWAVDTRVHPPGPYYYWIVNLRAKEGEQLFGPYRATFDKSNP